MSKYNVAVVGATGLVGQTMIEILEERKFPINKLIPMASERSIGKKVSFKNKYITVVDLAKQDFSGVDFALFSAGGNISKQYVPIATQAGVIVIDNTSCFRYDDEIPLIVPEVNGNTIGDYRNHGIIANPNCSTMQMVVALKPIYDLVGITRINVATYQSVSGAGQKGIAELSEQTVSLLNTQEYKPEVFKKQIAFNVIPQIDEFLDNHYTREEMKMVWETKKIFNDETILVNPTAVRVPVFLGHSMAVHIETENKITREEVINLLKHAPGVEVISDDENGGYPTAVSDAANQDQVYVGRIREDISHPLGINLWVTADNVRKGAALNSVQILEKLVSDFY
ncbi:MAG: aspartate-semialdehyde dehydrogenase [Gammaproteobacteria bacterium]|nr:aspartate-semialdehyde dehydrogenase [Gammaproteobacteria bacterium]